MAKVEWLREKPSWDSDPGCLGNLFPHPNADEPLNTAGITERGTTQSLAVSVSLLRGAIRGGLPPIRCWGEVLLYVIL